MRISAIPFPSLLALMTLLTTSVAQAGTHRVDNQWELTNAINSAARGDTILIERSFTVSTTLPWITKPQVTIKSTGGFHVLTDALNNGTTRGAAANAFLNYSSGAWGCRIEKVKFRRSSGTMLNTPKRSAIYGRGGGLRLVNVRTFKFSHAGVIFEKQNSRAENSRFQGLRERMPSTNYGILLRGSGQVVATGCRMWDIKHAIAATGSHQQRFEASNCTVWDTWGWAFDAHGPAGQGLDYFRVTNCTFNSGIQDLVRMRGSVARIDQCRISGNTYPGVHKLVISPDVTFYQQGADRHFSSSRLYAYNSYWTTWGAFTGAMGVFN